MPCQTSNFVAIPLYRGLISRVSPGQDMVWNLHTQIIRQMDKRVSFDTKRLITESVEMYGSGFASKLQSMLKACSVKPGLNQVLQGGVITGRCFFFPR